MTIEDYIRMNSKMHTRENITSQPPSSEYISDVDIQTTSTYVYVFYGTVCQLIAVSGVVTNIINIICFAKNGLNDSVNISLLGLAVSDLGCLISIILTNICVMPVVTAADLPFDVMGVYYLAVAMPHLTFSRVSTWITAIITLERCLCIIAPLQIKSFVTPKRMFIAIVSTYIILSSSGAPMYAVNRLDMIFSPRRNKTILSIVFTSDRFYVEKITFTTNSLFLPCAAFAVIIVCTIILVAGLRRSTKWRNKCSTTAQPAGDRRNQKVAKMVVMISTLFISCFIPMSVVVFVMGLVPEFSIYGRYVNIVTIIGGLANFMECINTSSNIFIYYHMSAKYKETFRKFLFF